MAYWDQPLQRIARGGHFQAPQCVEESKFIYPASSQFGCFVTFENDGVAVTNGFVRDRGPQPLGDLNGDGVVDEIDKEILEFNWGACPCCAADLNGHEVVDQADRNILLAHLGDNTCNWVLNGEE